MIQSRCGLRCQECEYRESMNCAGCLQIEKPFWGESCPIKACCEGRARMHCGECREFPCALLLDFSYDKEQGDGGKRLWQCRCWAAKPTPAR